MLAYLDETEKQYAYVDYSGILDDKTVNHQTVTLLRLGNLMAEINANLTIMQMGGCKNRAYPVDPSRYQQFASECVKLSLKRKAEHEIHKVKSADYPEATKRVMIESWEKNASIEVSDDACDRETWVIK